MKYWLWICILVIFSGCETYDSNESVINFQNIEDCESLSLNDEGLQFDSLHFSSGTKRYLIQGVLYFNDSLMDYQITFDKNPFIHSDYSIVRSEFPLSQDEYDCKVQFEGNQTEIVWVHNKSRLYIKDYLSE